MYYDYTVKIPIVRGKIITKKKGAATYVLFQYGQKYNAEKNMPYLNVLLLERFMQKILI